MTANRGYPRYRRLAARAATDSPTARLPGRTRLARARNVVPSNAGRSPRQSLRLLMLVFVQYALLAIDIRFVAQANYLGVAIVNVCIAITTWYLTKGLIEARTVTDRVCFVFGGAAGALLAVYVT